MNVRNSMYRMVFALIVFPFLFFSLIIINIYSGRLEKVITDSLRVLSDAQVTEMTNFCEQQKDNLVFIGTMDMSRASMRGELDEETSEYLNNMLYSQVETMDYMSTLTILNKTYRIMACSQEHGSFAANGIHQLVESMGDRDFYISDVLIDGEGNKTLIALSRIEDEGELLGYTLA